MSKHGTAVFLLCMDPLHECPSITLTDCAQVDTLDEAIALVNSNEHGNGTALFTRSGVAARKFQSDVQVGMVGINVRIDLLMQSSRPLL